VGDQPPGREPQPATSLPDPGGRKTIQDARYAVDIGRPPEGQLATAQCRAAIRTPGLRGRPAHGGGAVTLPAAAWRRSSWLPGSRYAAGTKTALPSTPVGNASPSRGANVTFAKTDQGSGPEGF